MKSSFPFGKVLAGFSVCAASVLGMPAHAGVNIEHWQAPSGARVFFVENHALPIVDVQLDFAAGTAFDPPGKAGLASLTRDLLDLGAGAQDETAIANRLADLGAQLGGGADMDRASVSLRTLSAPETRGPALAILRDVVSLPRFPAAVVEREQARTIAALKEALTRPETLAARAFWSGMYAAHPYGVQSSPASLAALTRDDLRAFHARHYTAAAATVTLVGDLSRAEAEAVARELTAALPVSDTRQTTLPPLPAPPAAPAPAESRIAHPAAQAHVLLGMPAVRRGDPDYFPLLVGNYTLGGGGFVSRLVKEVRDKNGYAYSVYSYFMPLVQPGPFTIGLQTKKTQAKAALALTRETLTTFLADGPSEEELKAAKLNLVGSFPLRLDSNRKILDNVAAIGFYRMPLDYLDRYAENVEKVTAADVRAAFARHVQPAQLTTVVVGGE
ncbi:M16 family metallopeptidase [Rhodocyclus gracilis]|uniref:Insulinase family protein n=1 Tax=Rhodocyclus tenuis TaxID=1066 RepID=A0A6L5JYD2_RHOTE|nr:pitrilysin family protein [Rhodocyclus gracilis]MQY52229.1 insulinase family protein [Rhodocyclus gracilis]